MLVGPVASRLSRVTEVPTITPAGEISIVPAESPTVGVAGESPASEPQPATIIAKPATTALIEGPFELASGDAVRVGPEVIRFVTTAADESTVAE